MAITPAHFRLALAIGDVVDNVNVTVGTGAFNREQALQMMDSTLARSGVISIAEASACIVRLSSSAGFTSADKARYSALVQSKIASAPANPTSARIDTALAHNLGMVAARQANQKCKFVLRFLDAEVCWL